MSERSNGRHNNPSSFLFIQLNMFRFLVSRVGRKRAAIHKIRKFMYEIKSGPEIFIQLNSVVLLDDTQSADSAH